jgi:DcuC family C4-dicarboxylate transporter
MVWIGALICVLVFAGITLRIDTKLCLIGGGLLMCLLSGNVGDVVPAYCSSLVNGTIVTYTCISMGYAAIMTGRGCVNDLIYALLKPLSKVRRIVLPMAVLVTMIMMMGLGSAATVGVTAGAIIIPLLIGLGFSPAVAAAAVLMGTYGGIPFNPMGSFYLMAVEADPTGQATGKEMINAGFMSAVVCVFVVLVLFTLCCNLMSKRGEADLEAARRAMEKAENFKVNKLNVALTLSPMILILAAVYGPLDEKVFTVPFCMFMGFAFSLLRWRKNYKEVATAFFKGQGEAFFGIITLMASAAVFAKGMEDIGIVEAIVGAMKVNPSLSKISATVFPAMMGALSGSGNAPTIAFIESILPHAYEIGVDYNGLASLVIKTGSYGRTFSPVAAVTIIVCGIAKAEPLQVIKLTVVPAVAVAVITMILTPM